MDMAQRIKSARMAKGYKQEYVAQALGVSRQAVSKWETGQTQPDTKNLIALAQLLEVSVDQLAAKDTPVNPPSADKSRTLRRGSLVLFAASSLLWCLGFFSGAYSTMLFIPVSDSLSVGIPFIWYGKSARALLIKAVQIFSLTLSLLLRVMAWSVNTEKQALG